MILAGPIELSQGEMGLILLILLGGALVVFVCLGILTYVGLCVGHLVAGHARPWSHHRGALVPATLLAAVSPWLWIMGTGRTLPGGSARVLPVVVALGAGVAIGAAGRGSEDREGDSDGASSLR